MSDNDDDRSVSSSNQDGVMAIVGAMDGSAQRPAQVRQPLIHQSVRMSVSHSLTQCESVSHSLTQCQSVSQP